jgi:hypothetical protein
MARVGLEQLFLGVAPGQSLSEDRRLYVLAGSEEVQRTAQSALRREVACEKRNK